LRYFSPYELKRKALILGPSFLKAQLEGAKNVPPSWGAVARASRSPVLVRPRVRVLNSPGRSSIILYAGGGGRRRESTPWITPLLPNCDVVSFYRSERGRIRTMLAATTLL
jgi:hypothetical protein